MKNQNKNNEHRRRGDRFTAGLKVSMTVQLLLMTAFAGMMTIPTVAAADECKDDSWGAGWEYPSCTFSCSAGETVAVGVSQEDNDYVSGSAECNGARASCTGTGSCDMRGVTTASSSGSGSCEGSVYSNWATDAHIKCTSGDGSLNLRDILPGRLPGGSVGGCDSLPLDLPGGNWRFVHMTESSGLIFDSEGFCATFQPNVVHEDGFTRISL